MPEQNHNSAQNQNKLLAQRLNNVEVSAIRELFKLLGKPGIISFAGGFPDVALLDKEGLAEASAQVFQNNAQAALQYGATEGLPRLREQLSQALVDTGAEVRSEDLLVSTGSQQALDLLGKTLINPGDKVIVEAPTFLATMACFRLYGAQLVGAPVDENGVDPQALEALIIQHRPKLVYLIPSFSNPTGAVCTLERRLRILELARQHRVLVVEDDPYSALYFHTPPPPSLLALSSQVEGSRDWLVYCGSLSKILAPGLRIGYLVAPHWLLSKAVMCKQFADAHTSTLAQAVASSYLASGRMPAALVHMRTAYADRAQAMVRALQVQLGGQLVFTAPQGGLFVWAALKSTAQGQCQDATVLNQRAIAQGVAFVPGAPFYAEAPQVNTLRLSFATTGVEAIEEGVRRLARGVEG